MIKVLELFSGTRSIGKCCDALGWDSVSVDMILPADHKVDIMDFDYKQYPKDTFDIVWASPPCTNYSPLKKCWYGRKLKDGTIYCKELNDKDQDEADKLVLKTLEIIKYFNPHVWFLENPQTGNLKNRDIMKDIPFYDVDYCMYSNWGYRKRTRIWTNKEDWNNLLCDGSGSCGNMVGIQHKKVLANGYEMIDGKKVLCNTKELRDKLRKYKLKHQKGIGLGKKETDAGQINVKGGGTNRLERYRIPEDLIYSLFLD
jgi:site-specific DNA-cytosine methylase